MGGYFYTNPFSCFFLFRETTLSYSVSGAISAPLDQEIVPFAMKAWRKNSTSLNGSKIGPFPTYCEKSTSPSAPSSKTM